MSPSLASRLSMTAAANVSAVALGLYKQYLIATLLAVTAFGTYGTALAWAALATVLIPCPAYLRLLSQGMSASKDDDLLREQLARESRTELLVMTASAIVILLFLWGLSAASGSPVALPASLVLLAIAQYLGATTDIQLRMRDQFNDIALLQATRNVPALLALLLLPVTTPMEVALVELSSTAIVVACVRSRHARPVLRPAWARLWSALRLDSQGLTLWWARAFQTLNRSALRIAVPLVFGSHEVGLYFFALIAQTPTAILLSVNSQVFGRTLALAGSGDAQKLWRTQLGYALPSFAYFGAVLVAMPFWGQLTALAPTLGRYTGASVLVPAVVLCGVVQASDCLEFMLFKSKRSRILLLYNVAGCAIQLACLVACAVLKVALPVTLYVVGVASLMSLAATTALVFQRVSSGQWA